MIVTQVFDMYGNRLKIVRIPEKDRFKLFRNKDEYAFAVGTYSEMLDEIYAIIHRQLIDFVSGGCAWHEEANH